MSLVTGKGADDVPLYVTVRPPALISCGIGTPPDQAVRDIRGDWPPLKP